MDTRTCWIVGIVLGVVGLVALFVAAGTEAVAFYWTGLGVFAACVAGIFWVMRRGFDAAHLRPRDSEDLAPRQR